MVYNVGKLIVMGRRGRLSRFFWDMEGFPKDERRELRALSIT